MRILGLVQVFPQIFDIQKHHVSTGKQASHHSPKLQVHGRAHISDTTNHDRNEATYSHRGLGLQLDVSQLSIGTWLAWNGQDDHTLVRVDAARDVLELHRQDVDRYETGELAAAAVVTVGHGVVHVRVSDDLTGLRVHFCGVPVRLGVIEGTYVVMVSGGGPATTEACDRDVAIVAKKTVVGSGIDVRNRRAQKVGAARGRKGSGTGAARSSRNSRERSGVGWGGQVLKALS